MATWFAEAASIADDERATVWVDQAIPILKGMLYAAALEGGGIEQFRRWLQQGQFASREVYGVLMKHARAAAEGADRIEKEQVAFDYLNPWKALHADGGIGSIQLTLNVVARSTPTRRCATSRAAPPSTRGGCWTPAARCAWSLPRATRSATPRCSPRSSQASSTRRSHATRPPAGP